MLHLLWELLYLRHIFLFSENHLLLNIILLWNKVIPHISEKAQSKRSAYWQDSPSQHKDTCPAWMISSNPGGARCGSSLGKEMALPALHKRTHLRELKNKRIIKSLFRSMQIFGVLSLYSQTPNMYMDITHKNLPPCRREWRRYTGHCIRLMLGKHSACQERKREESQQSSSVPVNRCHKIACTQSKPQLKIRLQTTAAGLASYLNLAYSTEFLGCLRTVQLPWLYLFSSQRHISCKAGCMNSLNWAVLSAAQVFLSPAMLSVSHRMADNATGTTNAVSCPNMSHFYLKEQVGEISWKC